jgi:hypothetical protein
MDIEITLRYFYLSSDFLGIYANVPMYMLLGIPAIIYSVKLIRRENENGF